MEKMDFSELIIAFGVPLKVHSKTGTVGKYEGTEWIKSSEPEESPLEITEPFIPSALSTRYPQSSSYQEGGRVEQYDMVWYSMLNVDKKTIVEHRGISYSVEEITPFTDYANVTQYDCKAVSAFGQRL